MNESEKRASVDPVRAAIESLAAINGVAQVDSDEQANDRDLLLEKLSDIYLRSAAMAEWLQSEKGGP